jgi:hypothetical protein
MTDGDERATMADVDHTHPKTGQAFGTVYRRGPALADGEGPAVGREPGGDDDARVDGGAEASESERDPMADVDHEAPHGDGARGVWDRGDEAGGRRAAGRAGDGDGDGDDEAAATETSEERAVSDPAEGPDHE